MKQASLFIIMVLFTFTGYAQDELKQGHISYTIAVSAGDNPQAQQAAAMLNGSTMSMTIKDSMLKVDMNMSMMQTQSIFNTKTKNSTQLIDMMGNKYAVAMKAADVTAEQKKQDDSYDVKYVDSTKVISGHICKKAIVILKENKKELPVWYDPSLTISDGGKNMYDKIKGVPLEYEFEQKGIDLKFTCTKIDTDPVDPSVFIIPDGYTQMSYDQFKSAMGGQH